MARANKFRHLRDTGRLISLNLLALSLIELSVLPAFAQLAFPTTAGGGEYVLNGSHSRITFSIGHFLVSSTQGQFTTFDGKLSFDPEAPEHGSVVVHILPGSISTNIAARDEHLRTADFFDVAKYPSATFQSTTPVKATNTTGKVIGMLSLHGVTRPISLNVKLLSQDPYADKLDFSAAGTLKRSDYGMTNYESVIGDEVTLDIEAEFDRKR